MLQFVTFCNKIDYNDNRILLLANISTTMNNDMLDQNLINEIGEYLGFKMWSKRDMSKEYDYPGAREGNEHADNYVNGNIIDYEKLQLLVYTCEGGYYYPSLYTLNMSTLKPTKNSPKQTQLSSTLIEKIKSVTMKKSPIIRKKMCVNGCECCNKSTHNQPIKTLPEIVIPSSVLSVVTSSFNQTSQIQTIERYYPSKKQEKNYPASYNQLVFEKFNEMSTDNELQNDYKKWKDGINYKTNRKIKIGGKIHNELKQRFLIHYSHNYSLTHQTRLSVLFEDLININVAEYLQETEQTYKEVDNENAIIKDYNKLVDSTIEKIQKLERWNDFIEFEGKKYGLIHKIRNNIHIENNCFGEMIFTGKKTEYTIIDRPFCNYPDKETTYSVYKCSRCNYENKQ